MSDSVKATIDKSFAVIRKVYGPYATSEAASNSPFAETRELINLISGFEKKHIELTQGFNSDLLPIIRVAQSITEQQKQTPQRMNREYENEVTAAYNALQRVIDNPTSDRLGNPTIQLEKPPIQVLSQKLEELSKSLEKEEEKSSNLNDKHEILSTQINTIEEYFKENKRKIDADFLEATEYINSKKDEYSALVSSKAETYLSAEFEKVAIKELETANKYRENGIKFMIAVLSIITIAFLYTLLCTKNTNTLIILIAFGSFLLVPAAYLTREAAKHRSQHNFHLQKMLNIRALSPYISTLPKPLQDILKVQMAERLFGQAMSESGKDSFPLNSHELIVKVLESMDTKNGDKKDISEEQKDKK